MRSRVSLLTASTLLTILLLTRCDGIQGRSCSHCMLFYKPVCGNNGVTYRNACMATCNGVETHQRGRCLCVCPSKLEPVCSSDGRTFHNACRAKCDQVTDYKPGACRPKPVTECGCIRWYRPVCAKGVTYWNFCFARCSKVFVYRRGRC